ncbi:MAG: transposase [Acidobacteriota bacterium]|nr:transposase [Acidobacteriota bacterium]
MTVRDIQGHLQEMYGVEVSAALISEVTDSIMEEVKAWQDRGRLRRCTRSCIWMR